MSARSKVGAWLNSEELAPPAFSSTHSSLIIADTVRAGDLLHVMVRLADDGGNDITNPLMVKQIASRLRLRVGNEEQENCEWDTDIEQKFAKSGTWCLPFIATRVRAPTWAGVGRSTWNVSVEDITRRVVMSQATTIGPSTPVFENSMFELFVDGAPEGQRVITCKGDPVTVQLRLKNNVQAKDRFKNVAVWPPEESEAQKLLEGFILEVNLKTKHSELQSQAVPFADITSCVSSAEARTWQVTIKRASAFVVRVLNREIKISVCSATIKCDLERDPRKWSAEDLTAFMCEQGIISNREILLKTTNLMVNREMAGIDLFPRGEGGGGEGEGGEAARDSEIALEIFAALTDRDDVVGIDGMSRAAAAKQHAKRITGVLNDRIHKAMLLASPEKMAQERAMTEARRWMVAHVPPSEWLGLRSHEAEEGKRERVELDMHGKLFQHVAAMLHSVMAKCEVTKIEMNCNLRLWTAYSMERERVAADNGSNANERWLWHGSRTRQGLEGILSQGFKTNNVNMEFNYYGAGHYFACDPRFSHMYTAHPGTADPGPVRQLLLCRVACGKVTEKEGLTDNGRPLKMTDDKDREIMRSLLRDKKNRRCPETSPPTHSIVGADPRKPGMRQRGREVVVFDENRAYPEFIISYVWRVPPPQVSPQDWQGMLTLDQAPTREPWLQDLPSHPLPPPQNDVKFHTP